MLGVFTLSMGIDEKSKYRHKDAMNKQHLINFKVTSEQKRAYAELSDCEGKTLSDIIRAHLDRKVARMKGQKGGET